MAVEDLIAEAREFDTDTGAVYADRLRGAHSLIARLAAALEAVSAASSGIDREALIGALSEGQLHTKQGDELILDREGAADIVDAILPLLSRTPQPSTDQAWREAAQIVLAEVKINGEPALGFIDRVVDTTPARPSTVTEATVSELLALLRRGEYGAPVTIAPDRAVEFAAALEAARLAPEQVTTVEELPVGSVFWGYYYPPSYDLPPRKPELARVQLTRGRSIVHGERMEYPLSQSWESIEVLYRPAAVTPESGDKR